MRTDVFFYVFSQASMNNYEGGMKLKSHMKGRARKKTMLPLKLKIAYESNERQTN